MVQKLLPHRTLGEIRDWRNANLRKRKAADKPRQKQQQQQLQEKLSTKGSGTFVRRPAQQQTSSAPKPCQLVPSDDLFQDRAWSNNAETQQPKPSSAPSAKGVAARPAPAISAAQQQQSMPSAQQATLDNLQQPELQGRHLGSDVVPSSAAGKPIKAAAALPRESIQTASKEASLGTSGAGTGPAADIAPAHSGSLEQAAFGSHRLLHRDPRTEIPDWSLPAERPPLKAEEPDNTEPALLSEADLVKQPFIPTAEPTHISDMDTDFAADPLFDQYEAMQQGSAAEAMHASTPPRAASAKPEEARQPYSVPGWTHQAAGYPVPALVSTVLCILCLLSLVKKLPQWCMISVCKCILG